MIIRTLFISLSLLFISAPAFAHAGDHGNGFMSGLLHPVLGIDHLLAMVAVGILSAQMGGRAIWTVPATFVGIMALGGATGIYLKSDMEFETAMIGVEFGIIASVILLGLSIALEKKMGEYIAMTFVAFFAFFHGFAHGYEFPDYEIPWIYISGFMCGTAGLHIAGVMIGLSAERMTFGSVLLKHSGSALLGAGLLMLFDAIQYYSSLPEA